MNCTKCKKEIIAGESTAISTFALCDDCTFEAYKKERKMLKMQFIKFSILIFNTIFISLELAFIEDIIRLLITATIILSIALISKGLLLVRMISSLLIWVTFIYIDLALPSRLYWLIFLFLPTVLIMASVEDVKRYKYLRSQIEKREQQSSTT